MDNVLHQQMAEDDQLRLAERVLAHLSQVERTYKVQKHKDARDLLLHTALEGDSGCLEAVRRFTKDPEVLRTFRTEGSRLLSRQATCSCYNCCLGLLAARLMCTTLHFSIHSLLVHSNGQRPSSITGMTKQEMLEGLQRRRLGELDHAVIVVKNHKTGSLVVHTILSYSYFHVTGCKESALICDDATAIIMIRLWLKILEHMLPDCVLAFPDFEGKSQEHMERKIAMVSKALGYSLPTATSLRNMVAERGNNPCTVYGVPPTAYHVRIISHTAYRSYLVPRSDHISYCVPITYRTAYRSHIVPRTDHRMWAEQWTGLWRCIV